MNRRGVCYDAGRSFGGPTTRPRLDMNAVRGELQTIRHDLHANAVRICAADISRVMSVAEEALQHGLEAWLCPELFEHDPEQTLQYIAEAAHAAEELPATGRDGSCSVWGLSCLCSCRASSTATT